MNIYSATYYYNRLLTRLDDISGFNAKSRKATCQYRLSWYAQYEQRLKELRREYDRHSPAHFFVEQTAFEFDRQFMVKTPPLAQAEMSRLIVETVEVLAAYLRQHNLEFWLEGGTLLGAYRNGKVIPWDNDGDFGFGNSTLDKLMQIVPASPLPHDEYLLVFRKCHFANAQHLALSDLIPFRCHHKRYPRCKVDGFLFHSINERQLRVYWPYCLTSRYHMWTLDQSIIFPLQSIFFEGKFYPCPNQTQKYLHASYGDLTPHKQ